MQNDAHEGRVAALRAQHGVELLVDRPRVQPRADLLLEHDDRVAVGLELVVLVLERVGEGLSEASREGSV